MNVSVATIEELMRGALSLRNVSSAAADLIISDYVDAEVEGRKSHGIGKFLLVDEHLRARLGPPQIVKDLGSVAIIDGNREIGQVAAAFALGVLHERIRSSSICAVGMHNFSRYGRLGPIAERIAAMNCFGLVFNCGGPSAVAPPDAIDPILGTNPICVAIPGDPPFIVDLATSERPWGDIRQAMLQGVPLQSDAFIDAYGTITHDPGMVHAVRAFGGTKGFALCMALELLSNAMLSGKVGTEVRDQYDLGAWFIALRADVCGDQAGISRAVDSLRNQVQSSRSRSDDQIYLPGERKRAAQTKRLVGTLDMDGNTYRTLVEMSQRLDTGLKSTPLND